MLKYSLENFPQDYAGATKKLLGKCHEMLHFLTSLFGTWLDSQQPLCEISEAEGSMFKLCQVRVPAARGSQKGCWISRGYDYLGVFPPVFGESETNSFGFQILFKWWICVLDAERHCDLDSALCWVEDDGPLELFCLMDILSEANMLSGFRSMLQGWQKNMLDKILQGYLAMHLLDVDWNVSQKCWPSSPQFW